VNDMMFSTIERDNDEYENGNCAEGSSFKGGWWFNWCSDSQLNGIYYNPRTFSGNHGGIHWYHYRNNRLPIFTKVYMKIRQKAQ